MQAVRIVTDSTADVPPDLASELEIAVVPCQVYLGSQAYWDGLDLSPQAFYAEMTKSTELPRTSHPPVGQFATTYRRLLEESRSDIVSIHIASTLSGTVNAAWAAAQTLPNPRQVQVIDTGQLSMGTGWGVIEAARLAKAGASQVEIVQAVMAMLPRLQVVAMIDTLENLYKGGRISQVTAALGTVLRIKPLLTIKNGEVSVLGRVRTRSRALRRLVDQVREWGSLAEMAVLHTGAEEYARHVAELLKGISPPNGSLLAAASASLTSHLGLGAVGVCALAESNR